MPDIYITPKTKTIEHRNPLSGHVWTTEEPAKGYEVSGGRWPWGAPFLTTTHGTLKSARKEVELRQSIERKLKNA